MSHVTNQDIAAYLRSAIRDGVYAPGDAIPSESALCRQFGTARGTVRQAVATLRSEGLVTSGSWMANQPWSNDSTTTWKQASTS
ncbi:GntR family transcriptional regulator [Corynebacterium cystitidis]|uniref:Regulatory protein, gntR family n=1 Tax=Corynebacterium cystitidis DSM 20524 TaxID=1121357 RepID=A0A1H9SV81_9CORY|nr:winged helix-turn-helix domain-containing protein [Corynebacterium cystitidis]SER88757.1 regulatory protein, gntR family [Corynebacterium cystitidis DSM 20524]SNV67396.1 HTH-type transcriptional repressor [Corynebacterium cystitidis]